MFHWMEEEDVSVLRDRHWAQTSTANVSTDQPFQFIAFYIGRVCYTWR